jgi:hypothetical protein
MVSRGCLQCIIRSLALLVHGRVGETVIAQLQVLAVVGVHVVQVLLVLALLKFELLFVPLVGTLKVQLFVLLEFLLPLNLDLVQEVLTDRILQFLDCVFDD